MVEVTIIFGKEQTEKILQCIPLSLYEKAQYQKTYSFNTQEEAAAFSKGIEEAVGWHEVYVMNSVNKS